MDAAVTFETPQAIAAHLNAATSKGGPDPILHALGEVIRARGKEHIVSLAGCTLEELRRIGKPGTKPAFSVVHRVANGLGLRIVLTPVGETACR
jgi:probable addiction module antidote protein